jgi:hypothetical protein
LEKLKDDEFAKSKLNEELFAVRCCYRAKNSIHIYDTQVPEGFPPSPEIHVIKTLQKEKQQYTSAQSVSVSKTESKQGRGKSKTSLTDAINRDR